MVLTSHDHHQKLLLEKKDIMKSRKYYKYAPQEIEKVYNTWSTGKATQIQKIHGYQPKNYDTLKNFWKNSRKCNPYKPLKRGYKCCRHNRNLKRGYCCKHSSRHPWFTQLPEYRVGDIWLYQVPLELALRGRVQSMWPNWHMILGNYHVIQSCDHARDPSHDLPVHLLPCDHGNQNTVIWPYT